MLRKIDYAPESRLEDFFTFETTPMKIGCVRKYKKQKGVPSGTGSDRGNEYRNILVQKLRAMQVQVGYLERPLYLENKPYRSYAYRVDLLVIDKSEKPIIVSVKSQDTSGTTDKLILAELLLLDRILTNSEPFGYDNVFGGAYIVCCGDGNENSLPNSKIFRYARNRPFSQTTLLYTEAEFLQIAKKWAMEV
jgi:hypothetical protein